MEIVEKKKLRVLLVLLLGVLFVCAIPASAQTTDWPYTDRLPDQAGEYKLTADVTLTDTWAVPQGKVTLYLAGKNITISGQEKTKPVIKISAGAELTLDSRFSKVGKISGGSEGIFVAGGTFIMNMIDSEISGNTSGVKIEDGTFEMNYGAITECTDGVVQSGGKFNMTYGIINYSRSAGVVQSGGEFNMTGGRIVDNSEGVFQSGGTFKMTGGEITVNEHGVYQPDNSTGEISISGTAVIERNRIAGLIVSNKAELTSGGTISNMSGVVISSGTFTMSGGMIAYCFDGVFQSGGEFKMTSGKITGNTRGVSQPDNSTGEISISGTAVIERNTDAGMIVSNKAELTSGGLIDNNPSGVVINSGTFTMSGGKITWGTIGVDQTGGTFNMSAGEINFNNAAGVVQTGGTFKMTSGKIIGNNHGVSQPDNSTGKISISGTAVIEGNTNDGLTVSNKAELTSGGLIDNNPSGVVINSGTFTMNDGVITGGTDGVVQKGGTFEMSSGEIKSNTGNGVAISSGTFEMSGGKIERNGTDGVVQSGGTFTMSSGFIENNGADGVEISGGEFTMSGGEILSNDYGVVQPPNSTGEIRISGTASINNNKKTGLIVNNKAYMEGGTIRLNNTTGAAVNSGTFTMTNGIITKNTDYGVLGAGGIFNMSGGTITDNPYGVYQYDNNGSTVSISGTASIAGNTSAGVYVKETVNMSGGTISGSPTGVEVIKGTFTMSDGSIEQNNDYGAVLNRNGTFEMSGGSITGNTAGLSLKSGNCNLSGSPVITGNGISGSVENILFNAEAQKINIIGPLTGNAKIGVLLDPGISKPCVFTSGLKEKGDASHFSSDDKNYIIGLTAEGEAVIGERVKAEFDTGHIGTPPAAQTTAQGALLKKPDFLADGYTLLGWYQDLSLGKR